jgi:3-mercaptopyruvate sulfurtransferase SseA
MLPHADGHVPGAVSLSPVAIRDAKAPPTFLPTAAAFEEMMAKLGVGNVRGSRDDLLLGTKK